MAWWSFQSSDSDPRWAGNELPRVRSVIGALLSLRMFLPSSRSSNWSPLHSVCDVCLSWWSQRGGAGGPRGLCVCVGGGVYSVDLFLRPDELKLTALAERQTRSRSWKHFGLRVVSMVTPERWAPDTSVRPLTPPCRCGRRLLFLFLCSSLLPHSCRCSKRKWCRCAVCWPAPGPGWGFLRLPSCLSAQSPVFADSLLLVINQCLHSDLRSAEVSTEARVSPQRPQQADGIETSFLKVYWIF